MTYWNCKEFSKNKIKNDLINYYIKKINNYLGIRPSDDENFTIKTVINKKSILKIKKGEILDNKHRLKVLNIVGVGVNFIEIEVSHDEVEEINIFKYCIDKSKEEFPNYNEKSLRKRDLLLTKLLIENLRLIYQKTYKLNYKTLEEEFYRKVGKEKRRNKYERLEPIYLKMKKEFEKTEKEFHKLESEFKNGY